MGWRKVGLGEAARVALLSGFISGGESVVSVLGYTKCVVGHANDML